MDKTVAEMTLQEIFDHVVAHLRTQGKRSARKGGPCLYRHEDLSCAVGCLIPDERYRPTLEGLNVWDTQILDALGIEDDLTKESEEKVYLLSCLQGIHDRQYYTAWETEFRLLAQSKKLTYTQPHSS